MLFTAPAFIFLFLPMSLMFCVVFGKNKKRLCLSCVCIVYHIMLNLQTPLNLIWLPLLALYSYFAARISELNPKKWLNLIMGALPVIWLLLIRIPSYIPNSDYAYPVGMTLPALCAAAYIWDISYGERAEHSFGRFFLYLTFFPIMLVGPFIRYSEFFKLTEEDSIDISLSRCSSGIILFAIGFVKRIAVGAVLVDGFEKILGYSWEAPTLFVLLLLLVFIYFGVFFSLSGYYDMAVGISKMYGIDVSEINAHPFKVATVNEYTDALFGGVREWSYRYVVTPISSFMKKEPSRLLKISSIIICAVAFIRTQLSILLICIPLILFAMASDVVALEKNRRGKKSRTGLRFLFGVVTILVMGAFWMLLCIGVETSQPLEYIAEVGFDNAEYQTDMILISFSGGRYIFTAIEALISLLPRTEWVIKEEARLSARTIAALDYIKMAAVFILFIMSVLIFLPEFGMYDYLPFKNVVI